MPPDSPSSFSSSSSSKDGDDERRGRKKLTKYNGGCCIKQVVQRDSPGRNLISLFCLLNIVSDELNLMVLVSFKNSLYF